MKRDIYQSLKEWSAKKNRKPLILMGARQVGKTHALMEYARLCYKSHIYLNFEVSPRLKAYFAENLSPAEIISNLSIEYKLAVDPKNTLIIFDEIQECPEALNSLKYFQEQASEYHVCAAGSLLGVKLANTKGFPVGQVEFLHLYPLSFFEFLNAVGELPLRQKLESLSVIEPIVQALHEKLTGLFKQYLFIGGMPEAVQTYLTTKDLIRVREVQANILKAYQLDFAKHAPKSQVMKISQVWDSLPSQLAKENKKFVYSVIRKGARAKEFEQAIQWLIEAGMVYKVSQVSAPKLPLKTYANFEFFKLYLIDVGLLGAIADVPQQVILQQDELLQEYKGALTENYTAQVLAAKSFGLFYWSSEGRAEIDFVVQHQQYIYPLEVKSGVSTRSRSLQVYQDKYHPELSIRTSLLNLKQEVHLLNCPLYYLSEVWRLLSIPEMPIQKKKEKSS